MTHGSGRSREWWDAVFNVCLENNNVHWTFALDGLPNESHKYRINQDGEAVWEVMKYGKSRGIDIAWQYIPFAYNEDHIQQAAAMAAEQGIAFHLKLSSRHPEGMIPINPANRIDRMRVED